VVLRAGEQEAVAETRSLLPLGVIRDVTEVGATLVLAMLRGWQPTAVVADGNEVFLRLDSHEYVASPVSRKEHCPHAADSRD